MKFLIVEPSPLTIRIPLGPIFRLRIPFSNTFSLRYSLKVRNNASQPYSKTGNVIVLYILIFKCLERSREDKSVWTAIQILHLVMHFNNDKTLNIISCYHTGDEHEDLCSCELLLYNIQYNIPLIDWATITENSSRYLLVN